MAFYAKPRFGTDGLFTLYAKASGKVESEADKTVLRDRSLTLCVVEKQGEFYRCYANDTPKYSIGWCHVDFFDVLNFTCTFMINDRLPAAAKIRARSAPNNVSDTILYLLPGSIFTCLGLEEGDWLKITSKDFFGKVGYVLKKSGANVFLALPVIPKVFFKTEICLNAPLIIKSTPLDSATTLAEVSGVLAVIGVLDERKTNWILTNGKQFDEHYASAFKEEFWVSCMRDDEILLIPSSIEDVKMYRLTKRLPPRVDLHLRKTPDKDSVQFSMELASDLIFSAAAHPSGWTFICVEGVVGWIMSDLVREIWDTSDMDVPTKPVVPVAKETTVIVEVKDRPSPSAKAPDEEKPSLPPRVDAPPSLPPRVEAPPRGVNLPTVPKQLSALNSHLSGERDSDTASAASMDSGVAHAQLRLAQLLGGEQLVGAVKPAINKSKTERSVNAPDDLSRIYDFRDAANGGGLEEGEQVDEEVLKMVRLVNSSKATERLQGLALVQARVERENQSNTSAVPSVAFKSRMLLAKLSGGLCDCIEDSNADVAHKALMCVINFRANQVTLRGDAACKVLAAVVARLFPTKDTYLRIDAMLCAKNIVQDEAATLEVVLAGCASTSPSIQSYSLSTLQEYLAVTDRPLSEENVRKVTDMLLTYRGGVEGARTTLIKICSAMIESHKDAIKPLLTEYLRASGGVKESEGVGMLVDMIKRTEAPLPSNVMSSATEEVAAASDPAYMDHLIESAIYKLEAMNDGLGSKNTSMRQPDDNTSVASEEVSRKGSVVSIHSLESKRLSTTSVRKRPAVHSLLETSVFVERFDFTAEDALSLQSLTGKEATVFYVRGKDKRAIEELCPVWNITEAVDRADLLRFRRSSVYR